MACTSNPLVRTATRSSLRKLPLSLASYAMVFVILQSLYHVEPVTGRSLIRVSISGNKLNKHVFEQGKVSTHRDTTRTLLDTGLVDVNQESPAEQPSQPERSTPSNDVSDDSIFQQGGPRLDQVFDRFINSNDVEEPQAPSGGNIQNVINYPDTEAPDQNNFGANGAASSNATTHSYVNNTYIMIAEDGGNSVNGGMPSPSAVEETRRAQPVTVPVSRQSSSPRNRQCRLHTRSMLVSKEGCTSETISVNICKGKCFGAVDLVALEVSPALAAADKLASHFQPHCTCCKPTETTTRLITLQCPNEPTKVGVISINEPQACACSAC